MRSYPTDSPKAISRLLALTMIVDGHLAPSELKAMHRSGILQQVRIAEDDFDDVVRDHLAPGLLEGVLGVVGRHHHDDLRLGHRHSYNRRR